MAVPLSITGLIATVVLAGSLTLIVLVHQPGLTASLLPLIVAVLIAVWRQFNGEYGTTVAIAPDGLRLRSGLVQTTAETIRPGRIQAVRLVEPLVWRAFGWCRLEVDVAGPRQRRENRSEGRRLRPLVPVGTRADAAEMLGELISAAPAPSEKPPGHARWKAPLQYHFLAWGGDDRYVVAARGRLSPDHDLDPAGKAAERPVGAGPRAAAARAGLGAAGRRGPPRDRQRPGPHRGRGRRPAGPAARPGPRRPVWLRPVWLRPVWLRPVWLRPVRLRPVRLRPVRLRPVRLRPIQQHTIRRHAGRE